MTSPRRRKARDRDLPSRIAHFSVMFFTTVGWLLGAAALHVWGFIHGWQVPVAYASAIFAPFLGRLAARLLDRLLGLTTEIVSSGRAATALQGHGAGQGLLKQGQYEEAAEWFSLAHLENPADWEAQLQVVEIMRTHLQDRDRLAEELNRLLKAPGVPDDTWVEAALELGQLWTDVGRPDRAERVYQHILTTRPEHERAEEAQRLLAEL